VGDENKVLPLFGVVNTSDTEAIALEVLRSGQIAGGEYVKKFEEAFGALVEQHNVVTTVDMTSAIFLALNLSGVMPGDEVITTSFACMATNAAIAHCGAVPVWADLLPWSLEIDIEDVKRKVTNKTKAVILYHLAGYPGPAKELQRICKDRGISFIEDCNNSLLAEREGCLVGHYGDFSIYSFYPNRQINCTEGGALVCKSIEDAEKARKLRRFGINPRTFRSSNGEINSQSDIPNIGWAITMNNLCSGIGLVQLPSVKLRISDARENAKILIKSFKDIPNIRMVGNNTFSNPSYWVFLIWLEQKQVVMDRMKRYGIHTSSLHQLNHVYSGFKKRKPASLSNTNKLQDGVMAIPCGWWLKNDDVKFIAKSLIESI
jgi:dTDP-4-amino-4,6-dideoxygalactose transaminase